MLHRQGAPSEPCEQQQHAPAVLGLQEGGTQQRLRAEGYFLTAEGRTQSAAQAAPKQPLACAAQHGWSTQDRAAHGLSAPSFDSRQSRVWEPDVALVNYYREGDTLGGHQDDVERDKEAPLVAISLGCDAIFLLGGGSAAPSGAQLPSDHRLCVQACAC